MRTPPWPVAVAAVLYAFLAAALLAVAVAVLADPDAGEPGFAVVMVLAALVPAMIAYSLWRGYRGGRIVACVLSVLAALSGFQQFGEGRTVALVIVAAQVFVLVTLTVPRSSRAWFRPPE